METYSLCIIDDKIPVEQFLTDIKVDNTGLIDQNLLFHYLTHADKWDDSTLYALVNSLKKQTNPKFLLSGFKNHAYYLNHSEENLFLPDIIIFDWDVGTPEDPETSLRNILETTYCLLVVYTSADKQAEVTAVLQKPDIKSYEHRLFILDKDADNSEQLLITEIQKKIGYFSFKYGKQYRKSNILAINSLLSIIGNISFDSFVNLFGEKFDEKNEGGIISKKCKISAIDFIEIMNEKVKSQLILSDSIDPLITNSQDTTLDERTKKLWHFRMYHSPKDAIVRKGDIIWHTKKAIFYLIISSDCHLSSFWSKNLGFFTAIPLYKNDDARVLDRISKFILPDTIKQFSLSSLVNPQKINNITILPFVDEGNDYILAPKEIESFSIDMPADHKTLTYNDIPDFDKQKRYRLNEPFLSALIEFALRNITDIGTPDYSEPIRKQLENHIKEIAKKEGSNAKK